MKWCASSRSRACSTSRWRAWPRARDVLQRGGGENEPFDTEVLDSGEDLVTVKAIERKSGLARTHRLPATLFAHHDYRKFAEVHAALLKQVGRPPFEVKRGERRSVALSFEALRGAVLELARQGVQLTRFKGLGEMNAETAARDDDGPGLADAGAGDAGRRDRRRHDLLDADGRPGRPTARIHRGARERGEVP